MRFFELARHAVWLVPTDRKRIRRFFDGLTYQLGLLMTRGRVSGAIFDEVVDIAWQIEMVRSQERGEREAKRPSGSGDFSGVPLGGHVMRDCLTRGDTSIAQPAGSVAGSSSSVCPPGQGSQSPMGRGRGRGRASSSSGPQNRIYALEGQQDQESSPDVVTAPLTKLTQKGAKFQWTDACKQSFQALKDRLTSAPVLTLPEGTDGYDIYCDASGVGLGCIQMQHGKDKATSSLVTKVKECQYEDPMLVHYRDTTPRKEKTPFEITEDGVLRYRGRLCVPNVAWLRRQVMGETHYSHYSIHPGATKMYHDIREVYWWDGMKKDIEEFVVQCPNC
ncbi:uncharacterized protein [Nicotiana tomentosiformis]|uniref:uncharacterized protein n=1 Tax=Nicotiana tomentosiformis TaxID=4098 RepID=UPI00388C423A